MFTSLRLPAEKNVLGTYVLMTAAHNEENFIEGTIRSVLAQTLLPQRWVIVSDNSSDRTDEIVESYARQHQFIRLLHITRASGRDFGSKVTALHRGTKMLEGLGYDFFGNVDADVSLKPSYFEELIAHFRRHPKLGLAGGFIYEDVGGEYRSIRTNDVRNVGHAAQLVRRECYEAIGGYAVLKYGGEDWYAQNMARMKGWHVEALPKLKIFHHRHTTGGSSPLRNAFRLGKLDYSFGSDPLFEIFKCLRRIPERPYFGNALARLAGFIWLYLGSEPRAVPDDFVSFLRQEQKDRFWQLLTRGRSGVPLRALGSTPGEDN
jgi:biofilm PGA synthesis N-glycosyltransferase PgaC